jgi:hypothetical protein
VALLRRRQEAVTGKPIMTGKPTVSELGIDLAAQVWRRSGHGAGAIEVAFARASGARASDAPAGDALAGGAQDGGAQDGDPPATEWVLMRVAGDPAQRVLVFDRHEWECFLDGARHGEFDDAAASP